MACCGRVFRAIADAAGLQHIIERKAVGDALRADSQRSRRDYVDLALAEVGRAAAVMDGRGTGLVVDHVT